MIVHAFVNDALWGPNDNDLWLPNCSKVTPEVKLFPHVLLLLCFSRPTTDQQPKSLVCVGAVMLSMTWSCQHPSHISSSCCPLSSPSRSLFIEQSGAELGRTLQWLDTSASRRPTHHPSDARARLHHRPCYSSRLEGWQRAPGRLRLLLLPLPEGEQLGLLLYMRLWGVRQPDIRVKENNVFTWSFLYEENAEARCCTHTSVSSDCAVLHYALWAARVTSHLSCVLCRTSSCSHCVFDRGWMKQPPHLEEPHEILML